MTTDPFRPEDLDYHLPPERIAQEPPARRDGARVLVTRRGDPSVREAAVPDLPSLLPPRTLLVLNDTRVLPARLRGARESTGGRAELLLVRRWGEAGRGAERWRAMLGTGGRPRPGEAFRLGALRAVLRARHPNGEVEVDLAAPGAEDGVRGALERSGAVPLPPYIRREIRPEDRERYQTVYAREEGAVAAPTAGLHFTPELLAALAEAGHEVAAVTLHVGPGTFRPIQTEDPRHHPIGSEWVRVPAETAAAVCRAREQGRTVLAVGTTVVRALESAAAADPAGRCVPFEGDTGLYVLPGHRFRAVDALWTNFHLPRSTLLGLVMAFHGVAPTRAAYAAAVERGFRFYSYGDAMLVLPGGGEDR